MILLFRFFLGFVCFFVSLFVLASCVYHSVLVPEVICLLLFLKASNSKTQPDTHNTHLGSSSQLRVYVNLSPSEDGLDTYETVNEEKQEHTYDDVKNINGESRFHNSELFSHQQEASAQNEPSDGYLIPTDPSIMVHADRNLPSYGGNTLENDERKGHVYAVVHIQPEQGKVTFCKDLVVQGESLDSTRPSQHYVNDGHSEEFDNFASSGPEKEVTNSGTAAAGEPNTQSGDESKKYLYAVVDKAKKKRKHPQVMINNKKKIIIRGNRVKCGLKLQLYFALVMMP